MVRLGSGKLVVVFALMACVSASGQVTGPNVRFRTSLGDIDVTLTPDVTPKTVANFLVYVNDGRYNGTFFHRSVASFVIQGGGYFLQNHIPVLEPQDAPVANEYKASNIRGTISMALSAGNINSGTNQWYFNTVDNSGSLDSQSFTVFGRVANDASLAVMDAIAALPIYKYGPFDSLPLTNYKAGNFIADANYVFINSIVQDPGVASPLVSPTGVITASSFGGGAAVAPGSYMEIYGSGLAGTTRGWGAADFSGGNAPTVLDGVTATVGGVPAYVYFVSPGQVNIQVPAGVAPAAAVPVVVTYKGQTSNLVNVAVAAVQPGLLAPVGFLVGGKQYAVALHANGSFVSNGSIPQVASSPARAGETVVFYGTGFGAANAPIAGQIASGQTALASTVTFAFGTAQAQVAYAGLAPGLVGVDQFNVVVPPVGAAGDVALNVTVGSTKVAQALYISVAP